MAVATTNVISGNTIFAFDVSATADGDTTTGNAAHGMASTPLVPILTALKAVAKLSGWYVSTLNSTNVVLTKATTTGSGATGNQVRATFMLPHSIII